MARSRVPRLKNETSIGMIPRVTNQGVALMTVECFMVLCKEWWKQVSG